MKPQVLVLHGPNLNLLGQREPDIYGRATLAEIDRDLARLAADLGCDLTARQSNHEGDLVEAVQSATAEGFLVNPGGLGHTSVSWRDAFLAVGKPLVEVHCSNTAAREPFRQQSLLSDIAVGVVTGFGPESYMLGLRGLVSHLKRDG